MGSKEQLKPTDRLTIGVITSQIHGRVFEDQWQGIVDAANEMDVNLIIYPGAALNSPYGFEQSGNLIFDAMVHPSFFDGFVIWTGALDWFVPEDDLADFVERFEGIPRVSMETPIAGVPTVCIGNYQGMWDLIQHLIVVHNYQRIAFISGPEGHKGMSLRYKGYCDCLAAHGLVVDADLVVRGDFSMASGETAVSTLLDARQQTFDVIVAANDKMAVGAMQALKDRDYIIPLHKAVVGFDDDQTTFPPLTTVYPPFYEMGRLALETCVSLIKGHDVPTYIEMPAELMVRRSCGCLPQDLKQAVDCGFTPPPIIASRPIADQLFSAIRTSLPVSPTAKRLQMLVQAFVNGMSVGSSDLFLAQLDEILLYDVGADSGLRMWHQVISLLRVASKVYWPTAAAFDLIEEMCHQARLLIVDMENAINKYQVVVTAQTAVKLRDIGDKLITAFGLDEVKELIADMFPAIGVPTCAVALYEKGETAPVHGELIVLYDENGRYLSPQPTTWQFTQSALPAQFLDQGQAFIVSPLYFREINLGVVVFGVGTSDGMVFETLRMQLSLALMRAQMVQDIQMAQNDLELRVATRTSELTREVEKHKKTAQALQKSEATTRALLEAIPDAIFLVDEHLRFLNFMPSEGMKTAVVPVDYLGLTLSDVFPPSLAQKFQKAIPIAAQTDSILVKEFPIEIGQEIRYYEARLLGLSRGNTLGIIRDVTDRKHSETERELLISELEAKNSELERFTYTVSHDLKSPLVTIKGFLGFLEQDVRDGDVEQLQADITRIRQAAEKMQLLLDDLLELSRIGHSLSNQQEVALADIVAEAMERVQGQIEEKQVAVQIQPDLPVVFVDKVRMLEVIQNLLDNAIKYMGSQTQPMIIVGTKIVDDELCVFVQDNGQGIEEKYHEKVFDLFDRLDQSVEGTGIGLALVRRIVELHNGRIWVESSALRRGATFYFTLPMAK